MSYKHKQNSIQRGEHIQFAINAIIKQEFKNVYAITRHFKVNRYIL